MLGAGDGHHLYAGHDVAYQPPVRLGMGGVRPGVGVYLLSRNDGE
jgi:hypothetical protein